MSFIAHIGHDDDRIQSLKEHLTVVRDLCQNWGQAIGLGHVCGLAGWLHDAGKYSDAFQTYIQRSHDDDPTARRGSVDHASAGGIYLVQLAKHNPVDAGPDDAKFLAEAVGNCIMAHHNPDGVMDYIGRVRYRDNKATIVDDCLPFAERAAKIQQADYLKEYQQVWPRFFADFDQTAFRRYYRAAIAEIRRIDYQNLLNNQYFFLRYILSTIIDADHTNTADFESQMVTRQPTNHNQILRHYYQVNEAAVAKQLAENKQVTDPRRHALNALRQEMSDACITSNGRNTGIYTLSVPTGGGKTLSSLRFGLDLAMHQDVQQLIYIVPYTTIIEQNADVIRTRLNGQPDDTTNILEYHSALANEPQDKAYYYARDTWDAPIILTSQVAFLEAIYGRGSKNIRHMHRLINAVLIFDEIQAMPLKCLGLNNLVMTWLATCHTTSLLCTATQPALKEMLAGLKIEQELVPDLPVAEQAFKRVEIVPDLDRVYDLEQLMSLVNKRLQHVRSLLVILNTKAAVKAAYQALDVNNQIKKYHLSTAMCQSHRQKTFEMIRQALRQTDEQQVVVFSTNLIEAGVDLSFEAVIRSAAGLDSVIQAAGRCNRNHEMEIAQVDVVQMTQELENLSHLPIIRKAAQITMEMADDQRAKHQSTNLMTAPMIQLYFKRLYDQQRFDLVYPKPAIDPDLDLYHLVEGCIEGEIVPSELLAMRHYKRVGKAATSYYTVASRIVTQLFQVIDSQTTDIIVDYEDDEQSGEIIAKLLSKQSEFSEISGLLKAARPYTVSVYGDRHQGTLKRLIDEGAIHYYPDQDIWIARKSAYNNQFGLGGNEFVSSII